MTTQQEETEQENGQEEFAVFEEENANHDEEIYVDCPFTDEEKTRKVVVLCFYFFSYLATHQIAHELDPEI